MADTPLSENTPLRTGLVIVLCTALVGLTTQAVTLRAEVAYLKDQVTEHRQEIRQLKDAGVQMRSDFAIATYDLKKVTEALQQVIVDMKSIQQQSHRIRQAGGRE